MMNRSCRAGAIHKFDNEVDGAQLKLAATNTTERAQPGVAVLRFTEPEAEVAEPTVESTRPVGGSPAHHPTNGFEFPDGGWGTRRQAVLER
jgi:hypothetical protein